MKKMQASEGHSTNSINYRGQRSRLVRTWKESESARGTHQLEIAEVGTSQDMERKRVSKGNSLPRESIGQDWSGHRKKASQWGALTPWRDQKSRLVRT
jgi:hypothetical protein